MRAGVEWNNLCVCEKKKKKMLTERSGRDMSEEGFISNVNEGG